MINTKINDVNIKINDEIIQKLKDMKINVEIINHTNKKPVSRIISKPSLNISLNITNHKLSK